MIRGMGERGVGRPLGQVAADSVGTDEQGRLEDPILRGQIAQFRDRRGGAGAAPPSARSIWRRPARAIRRFPRR